MIGILDSGIGGLSLFKEIVPLMPDINILYYADTANCPYGPRSNEQITQLAQICVQNLIDNGAQAIALACNTITAASATHLRKTFPNIPIVGMEPAIKPAAAITKSGHIGVLATESTLNSKLYGINKKRIPQHIEIIEIVGEGLVEMIETDQIETPQNLAIIRKYVDLLISYNVDTVVLGCTHYPFIKEQIKRLSNYKLNVIDPTPAVAKHMKNVLLKNNIIIDEQAKYSFFSSLSEQESLRVQKIAAKIITQRGY